MANYFISLICVIFARFSSSVAFPLEENEWSLEPVDKDIWQNNGISSEHTADNHYSQEMVPAAFVDLYEMLVDELREAERGPQPHTGTQAGTGGTAPGAMVKKGKSCYWSLVSCYRRKRTSSASPQKHTAFLDRIHKIRELKGDN